jgi:hypothetical protein
MVLQRGSNICQQHVGSFLVIVLQPRTERLENAELRRKRPPVIHVYFVFASPVKSFASCHYFKAAKIDLVTTIKLEVPLGKVLTHDSNELDWRKETGRDGRVAGRATQQARPLSLWGLDRIKCGRSND